MVHLSNASPSDIDANAAAGSDADEAASKATTSQPSGMHVNRRLKSFPSPDLEVVVGPTQRIYRYHSFILASYSAYVDTMLSSPMRERETKRISFPDIEPDKWEKMLRYLEPAAFPPLLTPEEVAEVLPMYDKYQFEDGMRCCDEVLNIYFTKAVNHFGHEYHIWNRHRSVFVPLAALSYNLELPKSRDKAIEYASVALKKYICNYEENQIKKLLSLVQNDDDVIVSLVKTLRGRHSRSMTLEEMRAVTKEETFPKKCVARIKQLKEQDETMRHLTVPKLTVRFRNDVFSGEYTLFRDETMPGALKLSYRKEHEYGEYVDARLEAADVFGNLWELAVWGKVQDEENESEGEQENDDDEEKKQRTVKFRWDDGYSSLVPPKSGWEAVEEGLGELRELDYRIQSHDSPY